MTALATAFVRLRVDGKEVPGDVKRSLAAAEPVATRAGESAGSKFSDGMVDKAKGLVKPLAGIMTGAGLATGAAFVKALDVDAGNDKLAAQLGVGSARSKVLGKAAGDLYSNAFGDSIEGVNDGIRAVISNIDGMRSASKKQLEDITGTVLNLNAAFDEEPQAISRAAAQLVRTDLAKGPKQALDIITAGFQSGANKAEDLLDTYNEYGTQFRKLGLNGKQATGLISQGLKAGARDADIVADSIKEFSLRTQGALEQTDSKGRVSLTALGSAFKAVIPEGADMYKFQENLAKGGKAGRDGLDTMLDGLRGMKDPLYQSQTGVQLFGTQAEDLGAALFALDLDKLPRQFDRVAGSADRMGETLGDNAQTKISGFVRTMKTNVIDFLAYDVLPALEDFSKSPEAKHLMDSLLDAKDDLAPFVKSVLPALASGLKTTGDALGVAAPLAKDLFDAFNSLPKEAQAALVIGAGAGVLAKKAGLLGGKGGGLTSGGILGLGKDAAGVRVFVTNPGFGGGAGGAGTKGLLAGAAAAGGGAVGLTVAAGAALAIYATGVKLFADKVAKDAGVAPFGSPDGPPLDTVILTPNFKPDAQAEALKKAAFYSGLARQNLGKLPDDFAKGLNGAESLASQVFKIDRRAESAGTRVRTLVDYLHDADVLSRQALSVPRFDKVGRQLGELDGSGPRQGTRSRGGINVNINGDVRPNDFKGFVADMSDRVRGAALEGGH